MGAKSFFNRKWPDGAINELMQRASVIPDSYQKWTHGRMPWIKLTSNCKVNGDDTLREKYQLFSSKLNTLLYILLPKSDTNTRLCPGIFSASVPLLK